MKTYLTGEEFAQLFLSMFNRAMSIRAPFSASDKIIHSMFSEYPNDIKETLAASLYGIGEYNGDNAGELVGFQFHKAFRQVGVINAKHIDHILWLCMQDAPVFWRTMDRACKTLTSEGARAVYDEFGTDDFDQFE